MGGKTNMLLGKYRYISTKYTLGLIKENECGKLLKQTLRELKKEINEDIKQHKCKSMGNSCRPIVIPKKIFKIFYIIYNDIKCYKSKNVQGLNNLDEEIQDKINKLLKKINN